MEADPCGQVLAVLLCALENECRMLLLWTLKATDFMHGCNIRSHFSSAEKYLDPLGGGLFLIICILGNKSALINADNIKSIVVGTQK